VREAQLKKYKQEKRKQVTRNKKKVNDKVNKTETIYIEPKFTMLH